MWETRRKVLSPYILIYRMVETIRISEEYHEWLDAHKAEDETMEEALRRMTRGPRPGNVAGLLSAAEAEDAKAAVEDMDGRNRGRLDAARSAFGGDDKDEG